MTTYPTPGSERTAHDRVRTGVQQALAAITGKTQLLQRQVLRADGLGNLERDQLLGNLAGVLDDVRVADGLLTIPDRPQPDPLAREESH